MTESSDQIPTYNFGDTIRVELDVSDESGVRRVVANFRNKEMDSSNIRLETDGQGQIHSKIVLEQSVDDSVAPGTYECIWVEVMYQD